MEVSFVGVGERLSVMQRIYVSSSIKYDAVYLTDKLCEHFLSESQRGQNNREISCFDNPILKTIFDEYCGSRVFELIFKVVVSATDKDFFHEVGEYVMKDRGTDRSFVILPLYSRSS